MDNEVEEIVKKQKNVEEDDFLSEYKFIAMCLEMGLTMQDLKELTYKDCIKIAYCMNERNKNINKPKKATTEDWDKLAR